MGSGYQGPGYEISGYEGSGYEGSNYWRPSFQGSRYQTPMRPGRPSSWRSSVACPMLAGLYLRFAQNLDPAANGRIHALTRRLLDDLIEGVTDLLPGYVTLYVEYDQGVLGERRLRSWLAGHLDRVDADPPGREVRIPVRYDGEDLPFLAEWSGLAQQEVVRRHSEQEYLVYAVGFTPGFPFMGEVVRELRAPRLPSPRKSVPAHSVGIAGPQTGIYPLASPGGWRLLGTALTAVYDPRREAPFLLEPGDRVKFEPREGETPALPQGVELLPAEPERPALEVLEPGLHDLLVDRGRFLVGRFGLARGGPLDARSASLANALIGNPPAAPVVEISQKGPVLEALAGIVVAFAGWGIRPVVNGVAVDPFRSFALGRGDVLSFARFGRGSRGYLALAGGIAAESYAGSASSDAKALIGGPLAAGNLLGLAGAPTARAGFSFSPHGYLPEPGRPLPLRLITGPQASQEAVEKLTSGASGGVFRVVASSRAGLRLEGNEVPGGEVLSEGVPIGAVQVPPGGAPILLLNDRGTLGGYAKPALLHPADLHKAGQLVEGDFVRFIFPGRY